MDKPQLKYRVVSGRNPKTGGVLLRPIIVERETYYMDQLVEYALNAGYVRGQFHDMRGALNGFVEAMQNLGKAGKAVNLNNWLRIHAELTGTVGDTRQLSDANELHVAITALTDLKAKVSDFSWSNIEGGDIIKVENISSPNGTAGEIIKTKAIVATGKNLAFDSAWGDKVTVNWTEGETAKSAELTPSEHLHLLSTLSIMQIITKTVRLTWRNPYVTDGLIAYWDGEWTGGRGHANDPIADGWIDSVGGYRIAGFADGTEYLPAEKAICYRNDSDPEKSSDFILPGTYPSSGTLQIIIRASEFSSTPYADIGLLGPISFWTMRAEDECLRVYNRILSEAEIKANYAIDKARFGIG